MSGVKINIDEIPPIENRLLGKSVFDYVKRFYENPENVKGFKEWQKMRRKQGYGPDDTRNLDSTFKALAEQKNQTEAIE